MVLGRLGPRAGGRIGPGAELILVNRQTAVVLLLNVPLLDQLDNCLAHGRKTDVVVFGQTLQRQPTRQGFAHADAGLNVVFNEQTPCAHRRVNAF